jgi:hypothetical protein
MASTPNVGGGCACALFFMGSLLGGCCAHRPRPIRPSVVNLYFSLFEADLALFVVRAPLFGHREQKGKEQIIDTTYRLHPSKTERERERDERARFFIRAHSANVRGLYLFLFFSFLAFCSRLVVSRARSLLVAD